MRDGRYRRTTASVCPRADLDRRPAPLTTQERALAIARWAEMYYGEGASLHQAQIAAREEVDGVGGIRQDSGGEEQLL